MVAVTIQKIKERNQADTRHDWAYGTWCQVIDGCVYRRYHNWGDKISVPHSVVSLRRFVFGSGSI